MSLHCDVCSVRNGEIETKIQGANTDASPDLEIENSLPETTGGKACRRGHGSPNPGHASLHQVMRECLMSGRRAGRMWQ